MPLRNFIFSLLPSKISPKRLVVAWKPICHGINSFVVFLSSLATFGAFCFAVWAYYYSSIPDQLVQKFNSEIAGLNEELVDMRREKRILETQLASEQTRLTESIKEKESTIAELGATKETLELEIDSYNQEKTQLQKELAVIQKQNIHNQKYRQEYLADSVARLYGETFFISALLELKDIEALAAQARDYQLWLNSKSDPQTNENDRSYNLYQRLFYSHEIEIQKKLGEIDKTRDRIERIPSSWMRTALSKWMLDGPQEYKGESAEQSFLNAITKPSTKGLDWLNKHLNKVEPALKNMPAEDRKKVEAAISQYLAIHKSALDEPITVQVAKGATAQDIVDEGNKVSKNVARLTDILTDMPSELSKMIKR